MTKGASGPWGGEVNPSSSGRPPVPLGKCSASIVECTSCELGPLGVLLPVLPELCEFGGFFPFSDLPCFPQHPFLCSLSQTQFLLLQKIFWPHLELREKMLAGLGGFNAAALPAFPGVPCLPVILQLPKVFVLAPQHPARAWPSSEHPGYQTLSILSILSNCFTALPSF